MSFPAPTVTIYTTESCIYCVRAKEFLRDRSVPFSEVDVTGDADARASLIERSSGRRTVPQIFVGEVQVGGYTDLVALDAEGRFQPLLVASREE
jgi:glutaredoxin 3